MKNFVITFRLFDHLEKDGSHTKLYLVHKYKTNHIVDNYVTNNKEQATRFSRGEADIVIGNYASYLHNFFEVELAR
ncbi:hypothetical protein ACT5YR_07165 [Fructobacillus fructosus]|uniref:hypothetical protein n=1 Tax=Fructobacillus fructosus TaxID=1631 RepID=UPI004034A16A